MKSSLKNKILFAGIALLLIACYKLAIRNTLDIKAQYDLLLSKKELLKNTPRQRSILAQKENYYDSILKQMDLGDTSIQNNLLRVLNQESEKNKLKVMDFNQPHIFQVENNKMYTYTFDLQGEYNGILKTIYSLEQKGNFGEVVHLDFEKKRNYRTNTYYLGAKVFIRQVK